MCLAKEVWFSRWGWWQLPLVLLGRSSELLEAEWDCDVLPEERDASGRC